MSPWRRGRSTTTARRFGAIFRLLTLLAALGASLPLAGAALAQSSQPKTVTFPSADGHTNLVGYLFAPQGKPKTAPAVVLMHGRSGAYSSLAKGNYSAVTIEKRLRFWAELWANQGYWALVVDSFGPRGYGGGFPAGSDDERPIAVNEITARPLDAYGALKYLRGSPRVAGDRIALLGWSNGGSAVLAAMAEQSLDSADRASGEGFRAAIALYPGCGLQGHFKAGYKPYAPLRIFIGSSDEEVSPARCQALAAASEALGGDFDLTLYPKATHDFDDPGRTRQSVPANVAASKATEAAAVDFLRTHLGP